MRDLPILGERESVHFVLSGTPSHGIACAWRIKPIVLALRVSYVWSPTAVVEALTRLLTILCISIRGMKI